MRTSLTLRSAAAHLALTLGTLAAPVLLAAPAYAQSAPDKATATDFTLRDLDGGQVSLSQQAGKVVVLSFWATWCGPCKEEMPHLQKLYAAHKEDGLQVISISTDDARMSAQVKPYIKKNGYTFPVLLDRDATVISQYNPSKTLPFTVVIDRDGKVAKVHAGFNPGDEETLGQLVKTLLLAKAPAADKPASGAAVKPAAEPG